MRLPPAREAGSGPAIVAGSRATDPRIRAVATVSAADIGRLFREGADGTQDPSVIAHMLDAAAAARTVVARGEGPTSFAIFPETAEQARALGGQHGFEGFEYYCTDRGQHPRSARTLTWDSIDRMAAFDPFRFIGLIAPRPLLMIVGTEAVTRHMSTEAFAAAGEPKNLCWIDGASHVDLYGRDRFVTPAMSALVEFFGAELEGLLPHEAAL